MRRSVSAFVCAVALFFGGLACTTSTAFAVPVTWTLSGATFSDGGTASGWFIYDADVNGGQMLVDFSVSVAGGDTTTFPPITYSPADSSGFVADHGTGDVGTVLSLSGAGQTRGIRMPAVTPLTDAGGTLALNLAGRGQGECYNCGPARAFVAGSLVGRAPPIPTPTVDSSGLLICGLLIAAVASRRLLATASRR